MKRCPECRRDYTDGTLNFCLDDGAALVDGPASMDEPRTAVFPSGRVSGDAPTKLISESAITDPEVSADARRGGVLSRFV